MTTEAREYYFLQNKSGETLYNCSTDYTSTLNTYTQYEQERLLALRDIEDIFWKKSDPLDIVGKTLKNDDKFFITRDSLSSRDISISTSSTMSFFAKHGTISLFIMRNDFLLLSSPVVSKDSDITGIQNTNTLSVNKMKKNLIKEKAPYSGWKKKKIEKTTFKDSSFIDSFCDSVLGGIYFGDAVLDEYRSMVSKNELIEIVELVLDRVRGSEVCDDD
jgi:hypothetical protein